VSTPPDLLAVSDLAAALAGPRTNADAERLVERLRQTAGADKLAQGAWAMTDELDVVWAIAAPGADRPPRVVSEVGHPFARELTRLGDTDVFLTMATLPEGAALRWHYELAGAAVGGGQTEVYRSHPDGRRRPGVLAGELIQQPRWRSQVFAGTVRDRWVYVPAAYDPSHPAGTRVFQDGGTHYKDHVPPVFDNLIAAGELPVTIGIFINPGVFADTTVSNRSFEYDTVSDQYSRFLLEEIIPEGEKTYRLRTDPESRAIGGLSSGGICAFTVAWQRPDQFRKVLSWIGSFTNIAAGPTLREGGHNYPALVRRVPKKPLRVFLQDGENDLNHQAGNWWLANQEMASSLAFAGYDCTTVWGKGCHSPLHGRAILPDSLRWLWRE